MNKPPSRYEVTVRVAKDDGHPPNPATFAVAARKAASTRTASVAGLHLAAGVEFNEAAHGTPHHDLVKFAEVGVRIVR